MASFATPPVGRHVHVIDPPLRIGGQRCGRAHCARCGFTLEFLLRMEPVVEIVSQAVPLFFTDWQTRDEQVLRG